MRQIYNRFFQHAYITIDNGVVSITDSGDIKNRRENVNIIIDNENNITVSFTNLHWRYSFGFYMYGHGLKPEEVLPEYVKTIVVPDEKLFLGYITFRKGYTYQNVVGGNVRLNKPAVTKTIKANNWLIRTNEEMFRN